MTDQSTIEQVDPRTLLVDRNIRHQLGIEPEFVASIREDGVLQPITVVRTQTGDYRVRFGHRRAAAAIEAELETVPVIVRGEEYADDGAHIDRLVGQWVENEQRTGLTNAERVDTINQLAAFGVSAQQIVKQTKAKRVHVDAALKINESELARKSTARWDWLDLEQLAVIAESTGTRKQSKPWSPPPNAASSRTPSSGSAISAPKRKRSRRRQPRCSPPGSRSCWTAASS